MKLVIIFCFLRCQVLQAVNSFFFKKKKKNSNYFFPRSLWLKGKTSLITLYWIFQDFPFFSPPGRDPPGACQRLLTRQGGAQSCLNCQYLIWEVFPLLDSDLRKAGRSDICPCVIGFSGCFPPSQEALATSSSALLGGKLTCERLSPSKFMEHCGFFCFCVFSLHCWFIGMLFKNECFSWLGFLLRLWWSSFQGVMKGFGGTQHHLIFKQSLEPNVKLYHCWRPQLEPWSFWLPCHTVNEHIICLSQIGFPCSCPFAACSLPSPDRN